jgi:formamidopyrimidine-DNA glycosylase
MPELPEAEIIARGMHTFIAGSAVNRLHIHREEVVEPMTPAAFRRAMKGRVVENVGRRAKWIVAGLDDGNRWVTQLRMTGRFTWGTASPLRAEPHLSVSFLLQANRSEGVLRFYDTRRFGRMWVLDRAAWDELDGRLGLEPLSPEFTPEALAGRLAESRAPIRNALLDQRRIAGVGNIYASEACYRAGVDPRRPAASLDELEFRRMHEALRSTLADAISDNGTSFSDYRDVLGGTGDFQNRLDVYGRAGDPCRRCGGTIVRQVLAGRSAFFCPDCQE